MSLVSSMLKVPKPEASPAANWTSAGRIAAAVTLVLAAAFPLASHLMAGLIGPRTDRTIDWFQWIANHPDLANLMKVLELLQLPFLFGSALVYVLLSNTPAGSCSGVASLACRRWRAMRRSRTPLPRTAA